MRLARGLAALILLLTSPLVAQSTSGEPSSRASELIAEGSRFLAQHHFDAALVSFGQARALAPDDVESIIGLARAEAMHSDSAGKSDMLVQANADYRTAIDKRPDAKLYTELGFVLGASGDRTGAIAVYRKALDLDPKLLDAKVRYADNLAELGDLDSAIRLYSEACAESRSSHPGSDNCGTFPLFPFVPDSLTSIAGGRGWLYFKKGDCLSLSLAEKDFAEAIALEPENAHWHGLMGAVLTGEADPKVADCAHGKRQRTAYLERAWSELRTAVNLDSSNPLDRGEFVAVSQILKRKPEYSGGIAKEPDASELSRWIENYGSVNPVGSPNSLRSLEDLADKQLSAQQDRATAAAKKALADAMEAVRVDPTDGLAWQVLGQRYMDMEDYQNAERATLKAAEISEAAWRNAPPPDLVSGRDVGRAALQTLAGSWGQLYFIYDKLHKRRDAERYRDRAVRAFGVLYPTSQARQTLPTPQPHAVPPPLPQESPGASRPFSSTCSVPVCPIQQYETCDATTGTNQYLNCLTRNRQEDARFQQCQNQRRRECSR